MLRRKGNYRIRLARPSTGVVPAPELFYAKAGPGTETLKLFNPASMLRPDHRRLHITPATATECRRRASLGERALFSAVLQGLYAQTKQSHSGLHFSENPYAISHLSLHSNPHTYQIPTHRNLYIVPQVRYAPIGQPAIWLYLSEELYSIPYLSLHSKPHAYQIPTHHNLNSRLQGMYAQKEYLPAVIHIPAEPGTITPLSLHSKPHTYQISIYQNIYSGLRGQYSNSYCKAVWGLSAFPFFSNLYGRQGRIKHNHSGGRSGVSSLSVRLHIRPMYRRMNRRFTDDRLGAPVLPRSRCKKHLERDVPESYVMCIHTKWGSACDRRQGHYGNSIGAATGRRHF